MINKVIYSTLKKASKTYFYNTLFFPEHIRKDVFTLYAFVRIPDDFVDSKVQEVTKFHDFKNKSEQSFKGEPCGDVIIDSFVELANRRGFDKSWVDAFFKAMEQDLTKKTYENDEEIIDYMYGSAEVVGLMMAKIMGLKDQALPYAQALGRVLQYVNFIRHIEEDLVELGRTYIPQEDLRHHGLASLEKSYLKQHPQQFKDLIAQQMAKIRLWQSDAVKGFDYLPKDCLMPIKATNKIYMWTGQKIEDNPFIVFDDKLQKQFKTYFYMLFVVNFFQKAMTR